MVSEAGRTSPSSEDWDGAIVRFQFFRRLEKQQDALLRARYLPTVLSDVADEIDGIANELKQTQKPSASLAKYNRDKIAEHVAFHGWAFEVQRRFVPLEFLDELPAQIEPSVEALRQCVDTIRDGADRVRTLVDKYEECVAWLRNSEEVGGRFPSVSMFWLIWQTDQWGSSIGEIAKKLVDYAVPTESKSRDPSARRVWEMLLKKGRARARKRLLMIDSE